MNDKLNEMLQMQVALNKAICKEKNLTLDSIGIENVKTALLDEIGELTHELKGNWCLLVKAISEDQWFMFV